MSGVTTKTVGDGETGMRLDRWFKVHFPGVRHGQLEKLLRKGQVRVDGGRAKANRRLESGEVVRIPPLEAGAADAGGAKPGPPQRDRAADAAFLRKLIIYQDDAIIALNKPFGLAVQGGAKTARHLDQMLYALEKNGERPRLVHRLDRDTGGLLLLARSRASAAALGGAFQRHEIDKAYWALVVGSPRPRAGRIDLKVAQRMVRVGAGEQERIVPADGEDAKKAITDFQIVEEAGGAVSFAALRPITGRKHQLRVHCAAIGAPIVGDRKYGGSAAMVEGVGDILHLFCRQMTFPHPATGKITTIAADLSGPMLKTWRFFGFDQDAEISWPEAL